MPEEALRFGYNMDFEYAMRNLFGQKYYGYAGAFSNPGVSKTCLRRAITRIRKRLKEIITTDERLVLTTSVVLEKLDRYVKCTSTRSNYDWFIIANLLDLISLLLGYDWYDGKTHRNIIFHQDKAQEDEDYRQKIGRAFWDEFPWGDWRIRF